MQIESKEMEEFTKKCNSPVYKELNRIIHKYRKEKKKRNKLLADILEKHRNEINRLYIFEIEAKISEI